MSNLTSEIIDLGSENPAEIALVIDVSGSMKGDKIALTQSASLKLIKLLRLNKDSLGICSFNSASEVVWADGTKVKLLKDSSDQSSAMAAVHGLVADGGTDMYHGLKPASEMFTSGVSNKAVVLLSDGKDSSTEKEKDLARELNENGKEVYTIAIGSGADRPLLRELAGDDSRYEAVADAFAVNEVFHDIIGQLGVAHVLLNKIQEIPVEEFTGRVYPELRPENKVPSGKTEIVIAISWDKLDVTCEGVNELVLLKENQIAFTVGKAESDSLVRSESSDLDILHNEKGTLIVKVSNVNAGDAYGVEMEKYFDLKETVRFSVGVFA